MTSYYNSLQHSSNVSEVSSTSPSPASCNTTPGSTQRFGTVVPNRVFVGGIASNTSESELRELFGHYGNVKEINIISDRGGVCKGYGFVTFETEEEAQRVQHEPDTIVLKERRLNIGPAVIKQQPFGRPYDMTQQGGTLLYHNGTAYTYQHGMAYFSASPSAQPTYSVGGTREPMYSAPFGPGQTTSSPAYPSVMYPAYAPPMPFLTPGQQYPFSVSLDYLKTLGQSPSQFIYASHSPMNGSLNGGSSQSPSPQATVGPPQAHPTAFYHAGTELYYNGNNHPPQPPMMYPVEPSPANHSEDWRSAGPTGTPVVSLLKLQEAGSVEELEITRTPKKPSGPRPPAPSGCLSRSGSRRPGPPGRSAGAGPGAGPVGAVGVGQGRCLSGQRSPRSQRSASSSRFPSNPNSCLHRSSSVSPSGQVSPAYSGGRQHQGNPHQQGQPLYHPRRGGNPLRSSGPRAHPGMHKNSGLHQNYSHSSSPNGARTNSSTQSTGHKSSHPSKKVGGSETVNGGAKVSPSQSPSGNVSKLDKGGAGDAPDMMHALPMSPPDTPVAPGAADHVNGKAGGDASICQKMQALAV